MGKEFSFKNPKGQEVLAYLAEPSVGAPGPGVVLVQEWWGVNGHMKSIADRLAKEGYRTLVPDLFHGKITQDAEEANRLMTALDWGAAVHQDIRGAAQVLKNSGGKVAVLGFCMGGALSLAAAVHCPELDAAVCFYGIPAKELADPARIKIPLLCHFAKNDDWCTPAAVETLEAALKKAEVVLELFRYDAQHAFFNDTRPEVFDAQAAGLAWKRTLDFLRKNL